MNVISKEIAEQIVRECFSVADFCRKVGWKPMGANYRIFYKYVKEYNLDVSHFTGQRSNIGNKLNARNNMSNEDYFKNGILKKSSDVIKRLLKFNLIEYKCSSCGLSSQWNGKPIRLQLHHIDGDHFNNKLENLTLLCPNCHSQTDTYCGRKNATSNHVYKRVYKHVCKNCGKRLHKETKTGFCKKCLISHKSAPPEMMDVEVG